MLLVLKLEQRAISQGMQAPLEAGRGSNGFSLEPPEGRQDLDSSRGDPIWTPGLQNLEVIHVCCFSP